MSTNKQAQIRYNALDRCFRNFGRRFYMDDLVEACSEAIYEFTGSRNGVKKRQIFDDIAYMESSQGWQIPLERCKDGKYTYYRYKDPHFSIHKKILSQSEAEQLRETLQMLHRFDGLPQFNWVEEIIAKLEDSFHLREDLNEVVSFAQNPYLKGMQYFTVLFEAIINEQVIRVRYLPFGKEELEFVLHPYYLKQYNSRWFLFAFNQDRQKITNVALDRIVSVDFVKGEFKKNKEIDFKDYFEDIIGVSVPSSGVLENVRIKVDRTLWPYIESKPMHGSQKLLHEMPESVEIGLELIVNYEFRSLLLSFGDKVEVLEPDHLRKDLKEIFCTLAKKYS